MKRLIRKIAAIQDGFNCENEYYEIFKNPTQSEVNEIRKIGNGVRGVIVNRDTYIWCGTILHDNINRYSATPIDISKFRFSLQPGQGWLIDTHRDYTFNEIEKMIIEYESILNQIGDVTTGEFFICFPSDGRTKTLNLDEIKKAIS